MITEPTTNQNVPPMSASQDVSTQTAFIPPKLPEQQYSNNEPRIWKFKFFGSAGEYFKIWIVNIFLTVITLSLYAPWAKVRRLRYFYGNTKLHQMRFDYTAVPLRIFFGRLIAIVLLGIVSVMQQVSATMYVLAMVLVLAVVPWIVRSTMRFNARNSKYGNARFYFSASMGESYKVIILCILMIVFTFGLGFPFAYYLFKKYQIDHLYAGKLRFQMKATAGRFYKAILLPYITFVFMLIAAMIVLGLMTATLKNNPQAAVGLILLVMIPLYLFAGLFLMPLVQGNLFKATWENARIGLSRIDASQFSAWQFAKIKAMNQLGIILSLGLLYPWAAVRVYRYKIESLQLEFNSDPNLLVSQAQQDEAAFAEEIADLFDIDISF